MAPSRTTADPPATATSRAAQRQHELRWVLCVLTLRRHVGQTCWKSISSQKSLPHALEIFMLSKLPRKKRPSKSQVVWRLRLRSTWSCKNHLTLMGTVPAKLPLKIYIWGSITMWPWTYQARDFLFADNLEPHATRRNHSGKGFDSVVTSWG